MKKNIFKNTMMLIACVAAFAACSNENETYVDNSKVDLSSIKRMKLTMSHYLLLADGKATLEFRPELYQEKDYMIPDYRVNRDQIEYYMLDGTRLPADYTTADVSLVGKKIEVYAKIKESGVISDTVNFEVISPSMSALCKTRTVPVVFHIIQTAKEIASYGGNFPQERIQLILERINNTFSGNTSVNPVGVDTKIRFQAAIYDQNGKKMAEPGINRVVVESVKTDNGYSDFIVEQHLLWPYENYLNIWVVSSPESDNDGFGPAITALDIPRYVYSEGEVKPEGLVLNVVPTDWQPQPNEVGIVFRLQVFNRQNWDFGNESENELVHYMGSYLGLLKTWDAENNVAPEDYCPDTFGYTRNSNAYRKNETRFKSVGKYFFLSENIMDDPTGMHRSVSLGQCERIHWVMENCPERSAWKSSYAFTGE